MTEVTWGELGYGAFQSARWWAPDPPDLDHSHILSGFESTGSFQCSASLSAHRLKYFIQNITDLQLKNFGGYHSCQMTYFC